MARNPNCVNIISDQGMIDVLVQDLNKYITIQTKANNVLDEVS